MTPSVKEKAMCICTHVCEYGWIYKCIFVLMYTKMQRYRFVI